MEDPEVREINHKEEKSSGTWQLWAWHTMCSAHSTNSKMCAAVVAEPLFMV